MPLDFAYLSCDFKMILLEQIDATLPPTSEVHVLRGRVIIYKQETF